MRRETLMKVGFWAALAVMPVVVSKTAPTLLGGMDSALRAAVVATSGPPGRGGLQIEGLPDDYAKAREIVTSSRKLGVVVGACQTASADVRGFPWSDMKPAIDADRSEFEEGLRVGRAITVASDRGPVGGSKTCNAGSYYLMRWPALAAEHQYHETQGAIADSFLNPQ